MAKKGKLGALGKIKQGITAVSDEASYADPASKHLGDWPWKPLKEVTTKLEVTEVPDYVQKGYGDFMKWQAARAAVGELGKRDLAKAFGITQSSIGRGGLPHASATKAGLKVPNTGELVRPEGAFAEWLGSKMGQRYLQAAERGEIDPEAIADIQAKFSPFGKPNQLAEQLAYGATELTQRPEDIAKIVSGDKEAFRDFAQSIKGINQAKAGFIGSLLGRGDLPTLDARQLNLHTLPPEGVKVESIMKRGKHAGAREAVDRLIARQEAMGLDLDPSLDPFYQHLAHHAVWDKAADSQTTHDDLVRAMRGYAKGGKVGALNQIAKAIGSASDEAKGMSMAEREAAKAAFMAKSKDPRRFYHGTARDITELKTDAQRDPKLSREHVTRAAFVTPDTKLADQFARVNPDMFNRPGEYAPNIMPVRVQIENPFDFEDPRHIGNLGRHIEDRMFDDEYKAARDIDTHGYNDDELAQVDAVYDQIRRAAKDPENYKFFEQPHIRDALEALGYDSFYVNEQGIKNLGVFDPKRIKSDIGNRGTYDINEADITKAHGGLVHLAKGGKLAAIKRAGQGLMGLSNEAEQIMPAAGGLRFADTPRGGPSVVKDVGGNWLSGSVENVLDPLRTKHGIMSPRQAESHQQAIDAAKRILNTEDPVHAETIAQMEREAAQSAHGSAINNWVDRNLANYIKKQMATPKDPVRRLAEEGVTHLPAGTPMPRNMSSVWATREAAGFPAAIGTSREAQVWEAMSDKPVGFGTAGEMINTGKGEPWMEKVDPFTRVHGIAPMESGNMARDLGFDHIVDVLKEDLATGRIRPEQLNKISMEQAVRRTHAYDQQKAKEMAETALKTTEGMPVHKEYPEGYKWIELKMNHELPEGYSQSPSGTYINPQGQESIHHPNKIKLEDALDYEGKTMGHCVGGYCPDVIAGRSRIYSLRDAKGEPHVTIEVRPRSQRVAPRHEEVLAEIKASGVDAGNLSESAYDAAYEQALQRVKDSRPPEIIQIKGKGNRAPKDEYLPFVQDFVKGGQWSDVGDLQNTGLVKALNNQYITEAEAKEHFAPRIKQAVNFLQTHPAFEEQRLARAKRDKDLLNMDFDQQRELERIYGAPIVPNSPYSASELLNIIQRPEENISGLSEYYPSLSRWLEEAEKGMTHHGYAPPTEGMKAGGAVNPGQSNYDDGGEVFQDPMGAPSYTVDPQDREHLKRMVSVAKRHLAETNRKIKKHGVPDMVMHSLVAPAIGGASDILNFPLEIADWAQSKVPALSKPDTVLSMYDTKQTSPHIQTEWDRVPKYPLASEQPYMGTSDVRDLMAKYGVVTGEEYPFYDQIGEFVVDPFIGYKALKAGYKGGKKAYGALRTLNP